MKELIITLIHFSQQPIANIDWKVILREKDMLLVSLSVKIKCD